MPDSKSDSYRMTIRIRLDESSVRILNIFQKYPNREFKVSMLITILEYEGIEIGYGALTRKLTNLVILNLLAVEMGSRFHKYKLAPLGRSN